MTVVDAYPYNVMGKISRTVTSSNLTVAIKNFDGTNFSASAPMVIKIGDAPRSLTGALSVTVNAGSNFFNLGSTELKTLRQDLFVYLGWRAASSTIFILLSRLPYGVTYADFSASQTNEKYGAFSGSTPASTDKVENIGRVSVQNSGTAAFNWSVPAVDVVINRPIYETDWLTYAGQVSASTGTITTVGTVTTTYQVVGRNFNYTHVVAITTNGTGAGYLKVSMPFTPSNAAQIHKGYNSNTGAMIYCQFLTNFAYYTKTDGSYPIASGQTIFGSGELVSL